MTCKFLLLTLLIACASAHAQCPDETQSAALAAQWFDKQPIRGLPSNLLPADAACARDRFVEQLRKRLGRVVGYKAALTNPAVQKRFGASAPVRGTLLARMLVLESAFPVDSKFGARPVIEADLLVEVGDEAINDARTPMEALRALSRVFPFMELADLVAAEGEPMNASVITAINAGARGGIYGKPVAVEPTQAFADALRDMRVVMTDETGKELSAGTGAAILGHPLNAVLWLVEDIRNSGERLRVGDKLSLGSFSAPVPPHSAMRVNIRYLGLPGDAQLNVRFK